MTKFWGPSTWYLFHTLAEKIKEDNFNDNKNILLDLIKNICYNLPCPDCASHARNQLKLLNTNLICNKSDLKMVLFSFHNIVNKSLRKPIFTLDEMNEKYKNAITGNIVKYFIQVWNKKSHNPKLMADDLHRERVINDFITWWNNNHKIFNA